MRLRSTLGEMVKGRCRATNLCRYCQTLYVVETLEMLWLDAMENAPNLWAVLTAREHLTRPQTYKHLECLRRSVRRRWPDCEWFVQVEFQRRGALHLNLLIKGVSTESQRDLYNVITERWCSRVDAVAAPFDRMRDGAQWLGPVHDGGGLAKYLQKTLAHGLKQEQAPPMGWRGHRTSQTRGYLVRPASVMREEARQALRLKRHLREAERAGLIGEAALEAAQLALYEANELAWELVRIQALPVGFDGDGFPAEWVDAVVPVRT